MSAPIYLDTNATAPLAAEVREAMDPWLQHRPTNPSSVHRAGQRARAAVEAAREQVAALVGGAHEIVFTSGGTEADNLAIWSQLGWPPSGHLVISATEHPAVMEPAVALAALGVGCTRVPVEGDGHVEPGVVKAAVRSDTRLVSVMTANNETGGLQPIGAIAEITHQCGLPLHTDAVQAAAWLDLSEHARGADLLTLSGHKIGGPPGIGALAVRPALGLSALLRGGGQQRDLRAGTEPTALIVGFGAACVRVLARRAQEATRVRALSEQLIDLITTAVPDVHVTVHGPRLPNTVHLCFRYLNGSELVARLDLDGLAASAGSACHSGVTHGSGVLEAMDLAPELARGALRLSLGYHSTAAEIERAGGIVADAVASLRANSRMVR